MCDKCEQSKCEYEDLYTTVKRLVEMEKELNDLYHIAKRILEVDELTPEQLRTIVKAGALAICDEANKRDEPVAEFIKHYYISVIRCHKEHIY